MISLTTTTACAVLVGLLAALWERIPWVMSERLKVPEAACRDWQSWFSLPLVFLFPVLGLVINSWDAQFALFIGILILALSLALLGQQRTVRSGLTALLLLCLAIPCIVLPTLAILPMSIGHWQHYKTVLVLNVIFAGVVLGMLLTPILIRMVVRRFELKHGFLLLALLCLIPALLVALAPSGLFTLPQESKLGPGTFQDARCWVLALITFIYYCVAELTSLWKKGYLGQTDRDAGWVRLGFWIAVLVGLPIAGSIIWNGYEAWGLAVLAGLYAIVVGNMAGDFTSRTGTVSLWLAGASFAPLLPTLLAIHVTGLRDGPAESMGLAFGAGSLGNFLLQPMLERFSQRYSVAATMRLTTLLTLAFAALALLLALLLAVFARRPTF